MPPTRGPDPDPDPSPRGEGGEAGCDRPREGMGVEGKGIHHAATPGQSLALCRPTAPHPAIGEAQWRPRRSKILDSRRKQSSEQGREGNDNEAGRQAVTASEPFEETLYGYDNDSDKVAESCSRQPMTRREILWLGLSMLCRKAFPKDLNRADLGRIDVE